MRRTLVGLVLVLAGAAAGGRWRRVDVVIAVRSAPRCALGQLAIQYRAGAAGMGNDFGTIAVRNVSPTWCELAGPVKITGLDRSGRAVTPTVSNAGVKHLDLSPGAGPIPPHVNPPPEQLLAEVLGRLETS